MDLESLKVFCDVVETGSFSRAAQLNQVSQSAVSQRIRRLEGWFRLRLLGRTRQRVAPTQAGERLFRGSKEILARLVEVEQDIRGQPFEISVSTLYSVGLCEVTNLQRELIRVYAKVAMRLTYRKSDEVYDDVLRGVADVGLVAYPASREGIEVVAIREEPLVAVLAPRHRLAAAKSVSLADLAAEPFIAFDQETPARAGIDHLFSAAGLAPVTAMEVGNVETIKRAVAIGLGVSVLPACSVEYELAMKTLVTRPLAERAIQPMGVLVRSSKELSRAAAAVRDAFVACG